MLSQAITTTSRNIKQNIGIVVGKIVVSSFCGHCCR
jgi:hypothetical protein